MSDDAKPVVGIVAEGVTDGVILQGLVETIHGERIECRLLQPLQGALGDHGHDGAGWRGVRGWCRRLAADLVSTGTLDFLLVHVDADVAGWPDFAEEEGVAELPCPPPDDTITAVRERVVAWLGEAASASLTAVPSKSIESWILVAFFPDWRKLLVDETTCVECLLDPAHRLTRRPVKLLKTRSGGRPRKHRKDYEGFAKRVSDNLDDVTRDCAEAARLVDALHSLEM